MRVLSLSLAVLILSSCASNASVPIAAPMKSTNVAISARVMGQTLELPGILHQPPGDGPYPGVVMLSGHGGWPERSQRRPPGVLGTQTGSMGVCGSTG